MKIISEFTNVEVGEYDVYRKVGDNDVMILFKQIDDPGYYVPTEIHMSKEEAAKLGKMLLDSAVESIF